MPRSKPIVILQSILAGATALLGGAALAEYINGRAIGLANLVVAAVTVALSVYLSGTNTSNPQVVATQTGAGAPVVAGPASTVTTGDVLEPTARVDAISTL
jgi:type IV secretory pathway TrbF-like protein